MKTRRINLRVLPALGLVVSLALLGAPGLAQSGNVKTNSRMVYHNGAIRFGTPNIYLIWYGCWDDTCGYAGDTAATTILTEFMETLGGSPYFQINATYPDGSGQAPTGSLIYQGSSTDRSYSHGFDLTESDIQGIIADQMAFGRLPQDPSGIYIVLAAGNVASTAGGICVLDAPPHHGYFDFNGGRFPYGIVGNANRCPSLSGMIGQPTPNGNSAADAMASTLAHVLDAIVTDPFGNAWFDRYGLENADKCKDAFGQYTFGQTYVTGNGARANMKLGARDFLIQQNWVNARHKGFCGLSIVN